MIMIIILTLKGVFKVMANNNKFEINVENVSAVNILQTHVSWGTTHLKLEIITLDDPWDDDSSVSKSIIKGRTAKNRELAINVPPPEDEHVKKLLKTNKELSDKIDELENGGTM